MFGFVTFDRGFPLRGLVFVASYPDAVDYLGKERPYVDPGHPVMASQREALRWPPGTTCLLYTSDAADE